MKHAILAVLVLFLAVLPANGQSGNDDSPCDECDSPEYTGVNALPAVTMQIYPSSTGDTVNNDTERPPGPAPHVVVGYWEYTSADTLRDAEAPCGGEPVMKIAYPIHFKYNKGQCYDWNHWVLEEDGSLDNHPNSASIFSCKDGVFELTQWTEFGCGMDDPEDDGTVKHSYPDKCVRDTPQDSGLFPAIYAKILSGCGKETPH